MFLAGVLIVVAAPLLLLLLLAGLHLALWRFARQPPPLFRREDPVTTPGRLAAGVLGVGTSYLFCALAAFAALRTTPSETSLTMDAMPGLPAAEAGVRNGDIARGIDGRKVTTFQEFIEGVRQGGDTVELDLERDGKPLRVVVAKDPAGKLGVVSRTTVLPAAPAARRALAMPAVLITEMARALGEMITGSSETMLQGPVGVARSIARTDSSGLHLLATLLSFHLPKVALAYLIVLALDAFARRHYTRMLGKMPPSDKRGSPAI